jgi:hypothetical protein
MQHTGFKIVRRVLAVTMALALLALPKAPAAQAQADRLCFDVPRITNCISGRFRQYWEANGGLAVFGYPISAATNRTSSEGTFLTQDFERNRFELHPEEAAPYDVLLGRLSDDILQAQGLRWQEFTRALPREDCRWFPETRHNVCDFSPGEGFRTYWEGNGLQDPALNAYGRSLALFGLPLSEPSVETNAAGDTVVTQWFERARFEWHPDNIPAFRVLLGLLGNEAGAPVAPRGLPSDVAWIQTVDRVVGATPALPRLMLPKGSDNTQLVASPDGSRLLHQQQRVIGEAGFQLSSIDARTGAQTRLLETANGAIGPQFSPDGRTIAYTTIEQETWEFQTLDLQTTTTRTITSGRLSGRVIWPVAWTARGILVAHALWGSDAPLNNLSSLNPATGATQTIYAGDFWSATPSGDGAVVALLGGRQAMGGTPDLMITSVEVATGRTTTIARGIQSGVMRMAWSPDASQLLYTTSDFESGRTGLTVAAANGRNVRTLAFPNQTNVLQDAAWGSTSTLLVVLSNERYINVYDLPANDIREAALVSRASIPEQRTMFQHARLLYVPR